MHTMFYEGWQGGVNLDSAQVYVAMTVTPWSNEYN